jgi:hypothetical protein
MRGRLPEDILASKNSGAQSADWFPRLARERNHIADELKRLAKNSDVASIIDLRRLAAILDDWPDRQPPEFSFEAPPLFMALPQALGAAFFIESVTGLNDPNFVSGESA